jgi:Mg2+-importing ATPase
MPPNAPKPNSGGTASRKADSELFELSRLSAEALYNRFGTCADGLLEISALAGLKKFGRNLVTRQQKPNILQEIWARARNPLNALLHLATISYFLGDIRAAIVIAARVVLAITTAFVQEHRSNEAAARLMAMVHTTASARRTPSNGRLYTTACRFG